MDEETRRALRSAVDQMAAHVDGIKSDIITAHDSVAGQIKPIRSEMATKHELEMLRAELKRELEVIRAAITKT
ncbi:MAG: hypothetical protein IS632_07780 [Thaumarchaeota archaeon]|nr:hypothetical protein [Nitrososphaerota archaeon]